MCRIAGQAGHEGRPAKLHRGQVERIRHVPVQGRGSGRPRHPHTESAPAKGVNVHLVNMLFREPGGLPGANSAGKRMWRTRAPGTVVVVVGDVALN